MKNIALLLLFSVLISGCESQPVPAEDRTKVESTCGTTDPVTELAWLKGVIGQDMTSLWISAYKKKTVIVYDKVVTNALPDALYYCDGTKVTFDSKQDEEAFFAALDLSTAKAIQVNR